MRKYLYILEYRVRCYKSRRWRAWVPSIDAGIPYIRKNSALRRAAELKRHVSGDIQYRVTKYRSTGWWPV